MSTVVRHLEDLQSFLDPPGWKRLLLIADNGAMQHSGAADRLHAILSGRDVEVFDQFTPNPTWERVLECVRQLRRLNAQAIIAVGGGTAIDIAKLVSHFEPCGNLPEQPGDAIKLLRSDVATGRQLPLLAVPTTAGTGSEATRFAVVYVGDQKYSVSHPELIPDYVVLDASLTFSLPPHVTAASGLDAMSQAIESMWSVKSTEASIAFAERALKLCRENLAAAVLQPNAANRAAMLEAAHLSGQAINISETTAAHALSYSMTIRHGVPHGMAVAISIARLLELNSLTDVSTLMDPRGIHHVRSVIKRIRTAFGIASTDDRVERFREQWDLLLQQVGCPTRLTDWGIHRRDCEVIADSVNAQRLANNPRRLIRSDLLELLVDILENGPGLISDTDRGDHRDK